MRNKLCKEMRRRVRNSGHSKTFYDEINHGTRHKVVGNELISADAIQKTLNSGCTRYVYQKIKQAYKKHSVTV
jgi:hypothetical protein